MPNINIDRSNVYSSKSIKMWNNRDKYTVNLDCFLNKEKKIYVKFRNIEFEESPVISKGTINIGEGIMNEITNFLLNYFDEFEDKEIDLDGIKDTVRIFYLNEYASIIKFAKITNSLIQDYILKYKDEAPVKDTKSTKKTRTKKTRNKKTAEKVEENKEENK